MKGDVIADNLIGYWRIEPLKDGDEVIGSRCFNLNIFDAKGDIPKFALGLVATAANKVMTRLVDCTAKHVEEWEEYKKSC